MNWSCAAVHEQAIKDTMKNKSLHILKPSAEQAFCGGRAGASITYEDWRDKYSEEYGHLLKKDICAICAYLLLNNQDTESPTEQHHHNALASTV